MAEQSRGNFHLDMSTEELMEWLRERGLGEKDLEVVKANGFLGKSFLLTTEDTWKLGEITAEGQVLLNKLVEEARTEERAEVREVPSSRDSPGSGSGQPPPPPAAPSQGRMLTAMATQATPDHSPEYLSFQENFGALVSTFKAQPAAYADILFSNGYIPDEVLEFSRIIGVTDSDKSRKILDAIIPRIKLNPSVFNCFITAIAGPFTDDVVKKLHDSYERHKTATSHVEQPHPHQQPPPKASLPQTDTASDVGGVGLPELIDEYHVNTVQLDQISTRTDLLGEDGLSDANQKGVDSYVNFWTGKDVLYVYFLNPDILEQEKWECEYGVLNIDNILSWAEAWNPKKFPNIPIFKKTDRADKADIRVKFTGGSCWAKVGSQAMTVPHNEPTMTLALKGLDPNMQKSLVIHQFGHALGLCHEHQHPDFWKVADSLLDVRKMKKDPRMKNVNFNSDILENQSQDATFKPEYDPDSVMHYWFDVNWLKKKEHKNLLEVVADGNLSEEEKTVLRGIHKRHLNCADGPSKSDLGFLQKIYASIQTASIQDQRYLRKLDEMISDKNNTIEIQYIKMHFIGPSGIGKTTTQKRLVGLITNLSSLPEDQRKRSSTFLAECKQALAFVNKSGTKLTFKVSENIDQETQLLFSYLMSCEPIEDSQPEEQPNKPQTSLPLKETTEEEQPLWKSDVATATETKFVSPTTGPEKKRPYVTNINVTNINVQEIITELHSIVGSSRDYSDVLKDAVLLNLVDIGGQPGFVEMFPFLSRGAGIFLTFFRLDKDLDEMCEVSYERGNDKITPYDSTYTSRETLSQILSAISHYTEIDSDIDRDLCSKLGKLGSAKPIAALIGTFKDELVMQIKVNLLYEKCFTLKIAASKSDSATASKSDSATADKSDSATASDSDSATADKSDSTTASKSDCATADKSDSATADSTTADSTTADKSDSATANSTTADSTTADSNDSTTADKSNSATADKSDSATTDKSDSATADKSDSTTASKTDGTTADKSDHNTADKSDGATADKSDSTTASKTDGTTADKSDLTTADKSDADSNDSTTADKSNSATANKSDSTTASKTDGTTADKSDLTTADKSDGATADSNDSTTADKSNSATADKSDSATADKNDGTTADKSDLTTADKSDGATANSNDSTTADKSDSTTTDKSDSTTADKSDSTTASKITADKTDLTTVDKSDSTTADEHKKAIRLILTQDSQKKSDDEQPNVTEQDMAAIQQIVSQHINSDAFEKEVENCLNKKLAKKNEAVSTITNKFEKLFSNPIDKKFIAVDNYEGTDIDPLRERLYSMISRYLNDTKFPIRQQQLLLGVVLRKERKIVSMEECIRIGTEGLKMSEDEVRFTVWYLDRFVGALIYRPDIKDKDGWFGNRVICNPQVVFNSLSALVVKPLLERNSEDGTHMGHFSLEMITHCNSVENKKVKNNELIPVDKLLILLEHCHLSATITTVVKDSHTIKKDETTYFIPAILDCASREELAKPPPTGIDTPYPIKITFDPQYVPIGIFCAMISELVSRGGKGKGILGMTWKLVDSSVKRNLVSFHLDKVAKHFVTLIAHVDCYEIRVIRQYRDHSMYELCSYVLSTILFVMKEISPQLSPIIAFDCYCGKLCRLTIGVDPCFMCTCSSKISLSPHQERWFSKEASLESDVSLLALPFIDLMEEDPEPSLSFKWTKRNPRVSGSENELKFKASNIHFKGFISCNISKNQKHFLTIYHCLKEIGVEDISSSKTDQLFTCVKEAIKEIRFDWYSLAIELDIDYATRKNIEMDYRWVDVCFEAMLTHWVKRSSPPPSWSTLVRALESPAIARGDIATSIKENEKATTSPDICCLNPKEPLNVNCHLRVVRTAAWEARAKWRFVGGQLGIKEGTLDAIEKDYRNKSGVCFTELLEQWLIRSTPAPTLQALIDVLKSPVIDRGDIAQEIESKLT